MSRKKASNDILTKQKRVRVTEEDIRLLHRMDDEFCSGVN